MNPARKLVLLCLRLYKLLVSPLLHSMAGPFAGCRYTPTCSEYAAEAVALHGVLKGTYLAVRRICRCNPWGGCGEDHVPRDFQFLPFNRKMRNLPAPSCCSHVATQHEVHFGCPPPVR